ncbi:MAG: recombinase family protein [Hyphomicrobiales bacterium]|nr:recombinase family protein [Hyphomicrobiales bacterium]
MKAPLQKPQRCAIYTRKSTDHNLDLAFNSLDAQREACEAYIKSQAHEGWRLVPDRLDDGAFSGASLDRPALQALIEAIKARRIDVVVVYKVDRLTRSLADFAKLVELFDAHDVSFVSVTQSFNTTSSMGRLTLNVLLSFAQFEREVIGERVRDKIAASKRKGIWVGGPLALGYRSVDKKLEVVTEEAALVRIIFETYVRVGSIRALIAELKAQGLAPLDRQLTSGRKIVAAHWRPGPLAHLLKNRFYVGEVAYRGEIHKGEHEAIVDRPLFEAAQARLAAQAVVRTTANKASSSFLKGLLFDDAGNAMSPSHANKKGVRYCYYVSQAILQGRAAEAGSVTRVSAPDVEGRVLEALQASHRADGLQVDEAIVRELVTRVVVEGRHLVVHLHQPGEIGAASEEPVATATELRMPYTPSLKLRKGVAHAPPVSGPALDPQSREKLLRAIARARGWHDAMLAGTTSLDDIAKSEGLAERYLRRLVLLAFLSPAIIRAIADGSAPATLTSSNLTDSLPLSWAEQERVFLTHCRAQTASTPPASEVRRWRPPHFDSGRKTRT